MRTHLSSELGFSREHRTLNVRRIAFVAAEITRHGGVAICAPIAPYTALRRDARALVEAAGLFLLVYVATPLAVCEARDVKGLYQRARAGTLPEFTGISDPYDVPDDADVTIDTSQVSVVAGRRSADGARSRRAACSGRRSAERRRHQSRAGRGGWEPAPTPRDPPWCAAPSGRWSSAMRTA